MLTVAVVACQLLVACGDPRTATRHPALSGIESYSWDSTLAPRGMDAMAGLEHATVVLYPDGRYEAVGEPGSLFSPRYESGKWTVAGTEVRFAPDEPSTFHKYRSAYAVPWKPGQYLGWVTDKQTIRTREDIEGGARETVVFSTLLLPIAPDEESIARVARFREVRRGD